MPVPDMAFAMVTLVFFGAAAAYVAGCDRLK
jgi:hypothetical protein